MANQRHCWCDISEVDPATGGHPRQTPKASMPEMSPFPEKERSEDLPVSGNWWRSR